MEDSSKSGGGEASGTRDPRKNFMHRWRRKRGSNTAVTGEAQSPPKADGDIPSPSESVFSLFGSTPAQSPDWLRSPLLHSPPDSVDDPCLNHSREVTDNSAAARDPCPSTHGSLVDNSSPGWSAGSSPPKPRLKESSSPAAPAPSKPFSMMLGPPTPVRSEQELVRRLIQGKYSSQVLSGRVAGSGLEPLQLQIPREPAPPPPPTSLVISVTEDMARVIMSQTLGSKQLLSPAPSSNHWKDSDDPDHSIRQMAARYLESPRKVVKMSTQYDAESASPRISAAESSTSNSRYQDAGRAVPDNDHDKAFHSSHNHNNKQHSVLKQHERAEDLTTDSHRYHPYSHSIDSSSGGGSVTTFKTETERFTDQFPSSSVDRYEFMDHSDSLSAPSSRHLSRQVSEESVGRGVDSTKAEAHTCQVCGDLSAGFHCGAHVCEACKKFFVRCIRQEQGIKFVCHRKKRCVVTKETRTQCQFCRFQKCVTLGMYRPGGTNISSEIGHIPCKVCGAPSSGYHFGAITCEGCKGFFRRTIKERDHMKYHCAKDGRCSITMATRNMCKHCRYQKCLEVGMNQSGSRIGRQPNSIRHATLIQLQAIKSQKGLPLGDRDLAVLGGIKQEQVGSEEGFGGESTADQEDHEDLSSEYGDALHVSTGRNEELDKVSDGKAPPDKELTVSPRGGFPTFDNLPPFVLPPQLQLPVSAGAASFLESVVLSQYLPQVSSCLVSPPPLPTSAGPHHSALHLDSAHQRLLGATPHHTYPRPSDFQLPAPLSVPPPPSSRSQPTHKFPTTQTADLIFSSSKLESGTQSFLNSSVPAPSLPPPPAPPHLPAPVHQQLTNHRPYVDNSKPPAFPNPAPIHCRTQSSDPAVLPPSFPAADNNKPQPVYQRSSSLPAAAVPAAAAANFTPPEQKQQSLESRSSSHHNPPARNTEPTSATSEPGGSSAIQTPEGSTTSSNSGSQSATPLPKPPAVLLDPGEVVSVITTAASELRPIRHRDSSAGVNSSMTMLEVWNGMMSQFQQSALATLKFAKKVPGFSRYPIKQQISYIQENMFPIVMVQLSLDYDMGAGRYSYFNLTPEEEAIIFGHFPSFKLLVPAFHSLGQKVITHAFTEVEMAFLCGLILVCEGDDGTIFENLTFGLQKYIKDTYSSPNNNFGLILMMMSESKKLSETHQKSVVEILSNPDKYKGVEFPQLFKETFISDM